MESKRKTEFYIGVVLIILIIILVVVPNLVVEVAAFLFIILTILAMVVIDVKRDRIAEERKRRLFLADPRCRYVYGGNRCQREKDNFSLRGYCHYHEVLADNMMVFSDQGRG